jgi:DNA repair photolyase
MKIEHHIDFKHLLKKPEKPSLFNCSYIVSPYTGCEYNCVHCLDCINLEELKKSPKGIQVKENAPSILKKELKKAKKGIVCLIGYQPIEKEERIVRKILEILNARRFPVHIITKSDIVLEDLNLLSRISENSWCAVSFCINTLDERITRIFEPNAPSPKKRIEALAKIADTGIVTGIAPMPIIPYITDSEEQLKDIIGTAAKTKANYILPMLLTLDDNCRAEFINLIKRHFPKLLIKYRRLYEFGSTPDVRYSNRLKHRIDLLLKKYGIKDSIPSYPIKEEKKQVNIEDFLSKR